MLAQQPKWVVNNSIVNPTTGQVTANPYASSPNHTQNAVWDENGDLKFYAEDGFIYNSLGQLVVPNSSINSNPNPNTSGHSEFVFVPVPEECNKWFAFSVDLVNDHSLAVQYLNIFSTILNYSILDGDLNQGAGGSEYISGNNVPGGTVAANWITLQERSVLQCSDRYHIGATSVHVNGKRYLFVASCAVLRVFELGNGTVTPLPNLDREFQGKIPMRTELEIYESDGNLNVAIGTIAEVTDPYSNIKPVGGIDIFGYTVWNDGSLSYHSHQENKLSFWYEDLIIVKGLEFSPDGKHLYATFIKRAVGGIYTDVADYIPVDEILHFMRPANNFSFYQSSNIPLGNDGNNFSFGMIETSLDGKLWISSSDWLGNFTDANNLTTFNSHAIQVVNPTTNHGLPSYDMRYKISLLPDQIDGEDFNETIYPNQYPETLTVCQYPYQAVSSAYSDWYIRTLHYGEPEYIGSGVTMDIPHDGWVTVTYTNESGCELVEEFYIIQDPIALHGAAFTYSNPVSGNNMTINVTALVTQGANHEWILKENSGGNWLIISTIPLSYSSSYSFTNLDPNMQYMVVHNISAILPYTCNYSPGSVLIIN